MKDNMYSQPNSTRVQAPTNPSFAINDSTEPGNNDDVPLSPLGRGASDDGDQQRSKPLFNQRNHSHVATHNVRTIRHDYKQLELARLFMNSNTSILGIVDHKIVHPSSEEKTINFKKLPGCVLITQSAWRNSQNAANGGVGLVVNKAAESVLSDVKYVNKRILIATFNGNPSTTVIVNYSPQEGTQDAVEHYDKLIDTIKQVPKHNLLLVLGDFNAHIGKEDANLRN